MDTLRTNDLRENKPYQFYSRISGEAGLGKVWFKFNEGKREFSYEDIDGLISPCHPCPYTEFLELPVPDEVKHFWERF